MSAATSQTEEEIYAPLTSCNKCYAVENHETRHCPKPSTYKVCSECRSEEHTFREYRATEKTCFHCGLNHSARAMRYPVRKKAWREKEDKLKQEKNRPVTYAHAASPASPVSTKLQSLNSRGIMCVLHAHIAEATIPGSFQKILSEGLAINGLPDIKIPPNPPFSHDHK